VLWRNSFILAHKKVPIMATKVVCYNCGKLIEQKEAFYLSTFDTYLCEKCYAALLDKKPIRLNNWRRSGV
jgi:hypothetical protein